jgi:hypothetical protein
MPRKLKNLSLLVIGEKQVKKEDIILPYAPMFDQTDNLRVKANSEKNTITVYFLNARNEEIGTYICTISAMLDGKETVRLDAVFNEVTDYCQLFKVP